MTRLGRSTTVTAVAAMIVGDWDTFPSWLSPVVNGLLIFVVIYYSALPVPAAGASTMPTLWSVVLTAMLSFAAGALVVVALEDGTLTYVLAGVAMLEVWMVSARYAGDSG